MWTKPRKRSRFPRSESVESGASTDSAVAREATIAAADPSVVPKGTGVAVPLPPPRIQDRAEALLQLHRINDFLENPPEDPLVRENQALREERAIILDKLAVAEREARFYKTRWEDAYAATAAPSGERRFKFDDERVTKEEVNRALEEQNGGEEEIRLKKEQEEKEHKKKEKSEAHLYTIIKVAQNEDFVEQIGRDIFFDLIDHEKIRSFRIQKLMFFFVFKEKVAKEFGIPVQFQRFWIWAERENHTFRPYRPLNRQEEAQFVGQLSKTHNAELKLFLEVVLGPDKGFLPLPDKTKEDILLFFKLYDPEKEELRYVGRLFVKAFGRPSEILSELNEMAGFSSNEEIRLYEEITFEPHVMCDPIDRKITFRSCQLQDGDIICYQKSPTSNTDKYRYPDVPSFLEYVHNRQGKTAAQIEGSFRRRRAPTMVKLIQDGCKANKGVKR